MGQVSTVCLSLGDEGWEAAGRAIVLVQSASECDWIPEWHDVGRQRWALLYTLPPGPQAVPCNNACCALLPLLQSGEVIPFGLCVWSTGVGPTPFTLSLPFSKTQRGRIAIDEYLRVGVLPYTSISPGLYFYIWC